MRGFAHLFTSKTLTPQRDALVSEDGGYPCFGDAVLTADVLSGLASLISDSDGDHVFSGQEASGAWRRGAGVRLGRPVWR